MSIEFEMQDGEIKKFYDEEEVQGFIQDFSDNFDAIPWLSDEDYAKAIGQFRLQFGVLLEEMFAPLRMYGQDVFVDGAILSIIESGVKLTEDFGLRVRGINHEISLEIIRAKKKEKENGTRIQAIQ